MELLKKSSNNEIETFQETECMKEYKIYFPLNNPSVIIRKYNQKYTQQTSQQFWINVFNKKSIRKSKRKSEKNVKDDTSPSSKKGIISFFV
jgi:hypothetical protein